MNAPSGTTIRCKGPLIMDYKKNIAIFNKDVLMENPKGKTLSKKMVVFFDSTKKQLKKAILTGNPVVFLDSKEAHKDALVKN